MKIVGKEEEGINKRKQKTKQKEWENEDNIQKKDRIQKEK